MPNDKIDLQDRKALAHIKAGKERAEVGFSMLYNRYAPRLRNYLLYKLNGHHPSVAEEICDEAFFNFYRKIDEFDEKCSIYTWLYGRLRYEIPEYFRRNDELNKKVIVLDEQACTARGENGLDFESFISEHNPYIVKNEEEILMDKCFGFLKSNHEKCYQALIYWLQGFSTMECHMALEYWMQGFSMEEIIKKIKEEIGNLKKGWSYDKENAMKVFLSSCRKKIKEYVNSE